jgi:hypothetical protein
MGASTNTYGAHPTSIGKEFNLGCIKEFTHGTKALALTFTEFNMEIRWKMMYYFGKP